MNQATLSAAERMAGAKAALKRNEPLAASALLRSVLLQEPRNAEAAEALGIAEAQAGNRQAALDALAHATELEPGRATAHYNYAIILAQDPNTLDDAVQENQTALLIKPDYIQALSLQETLRKRIQERAWRSDEDFAVVQVGDVDPRHQTNGAFSKLQCPVCGGMNFSTARICIRCGSLIPEMEEIVPVE